MVKMNSKPFKGFGGKSFNSLNLKSFIKALPSRKVLKSINGSLKSESLSTIDFSSCVYENQSEHQASQKNSHPNIQALEAPPQPVTMMTFSKVVDIFEELEPIQPIQEIPKPRSRTRRNSFLKLKTKKSSRPNTAIESIISNRLLEPTQEILSPESRKAQCSAHLVKARNEVLLGKETAKASPLNCKPPSAREKRLKYRLYNAPLDSFELQRRLARRGGDEKIFLPRLDPSSYAHIMQKEHHRRRLESLAYHHNPHLLKINEPINNGVRTLKLETIPEGVGSWVVLKDPRDPRKRRTKLDYIITSW
ncbi:uncharacterized protein PGTG_17006 [Puccinia graminis f. sp. tritici CRL 75-36-700-3]|uniref:Uncharacterized protein n=1 Tax=Puccinia graminis f. sp. tritici (strain CRL 75-36-700-3 / race SCCL) TaxID=418459 RepID=E3L477_PUCGT|nr:uncharacterized protein PGTG_17006 [Puccinia graminis f. sp. tritici CRL 75-36-700-3]EFP91352.1 hypothetical protein PGTG_17006 [Puccinia graminis f. sp. tritici CRL 75-36-700-3]